MLYYHLKLFLVECFANVFYYKNAGKIKKTLKNVKNVTRIKNVKNVFYICAFDGTPLDAVWEIRDLIAKLKALHIIDREFVTSAKKFANYNEFSEIKKIRKNSYKNSLNARVRVTFQ